MATMVAPFETLAGAAVIALAISCLSVGAFFAPAASVFSVNKKDDANIIKLHTTLFGSCIGSLLEVEWLLFICLRGQKNGICALLLFRLSHLSGKLNFELSSAII